MDAPRPPRSAERETIVESEYHFDIDSTEWDGGDIQDTSREDSYLCYDHSRAWFFSCVTTSPARKVMLTEPQLMLAASVMMWET